MKRLSLRPLPVLSLVAATALCLSLAPDFVSGGDRLFEPEWTTQLVPVESAPPAEPLAEPTWTPAPKLGAPPVDGDRLSLLVEFDETAQLGSIKRQDFKDFATDRGSIVRYEYVAAMPNMINMRNVPRTLLETLRSLPGVVSITEDVYHP